MGRQVVLSMAVGGTFSALLLGVPTSQGAITGVLNSDVEGFFGSASDT